MKTQQKENIILLTDLKYVFDCDIFYDRQILKWKKEKEYPNKSKEEIEEEIKEEAKIKINKLKKERTKYYQIDNERKKEFEKKFKQIKLKINFNSHPRILRDGKFYTIFNGVFTVYDEKFFKKITEIKFEDNDKINLAIQLDNKDIVFFCRGSINYI